MTLKKGLPAKKAATDANDTRYDFRNLIVCNADGSPRGGVTSPVGVPLVAATATMNSTVAAFNAVAVRDNGVVLLSNDGPVNVLHDPAPAANSRIDVIYAKQNDSSSTVTTPDADDNAIIAIAKGVAQASPQKPSIPAGAVEIATVQIPAGATSTNSTSPAVVITQTAQFTAAAGGVVPFRSISDRDAWTTASTGQLAEVLGGGFYRFGGTAWLGLPGSLIGEGRGTASDTIPAIDNNYRPGSGSGVTFTAPAGAKVRVVVRAQLSGAGGGAIIKLAPAIVAGTVATTTGATIETTYSSQNVIGGTGGPNQQTGTAETCFTIPTTGTYTAFLTFNSPNVGGVVLNSYAAVYAA